MEEPRLPDLRASDADRERTAEIVRRAAGAGQLDLVELDERLESVYAARTAKELERLTADLAPVPAEPLQVSPGGGGTRWVVSVMGGSERKGHWRVASRVQVVDVMGGSTLDFNDAELADEVVEVRVFSIMGGSDIYVPEGVAVEISEFALMGGNTVKVGAERPTGAAGPLLRIQLVSIMGGSTVRRGRRLSRRERRERRSLHP